MSDTYFLSKDVVGMNFSTVGYLLHCRKCKRKIIVECVLNGTDHNLNVSPICGDCVKLDEKFVRFYPEQAKQVEDFCGRGVMVAAPVSEAGSNRSGGSSPLDRTEQAKAALQEWADKQGHERCWYYPEVFRQLCDILGVVMTKPMNLPPRPEFGKGCNRYEKEVYEQNDLLQTMPTVEKDSNGQSP